MPHRNNSTHDSPSQIRSRLKLKLFIQQTDKNTVTENKNSRKSEKNLILLRPNLLLTNGETLTKLSFTI
jgi:hypothetical protein